jgi:hypothetical protein
MPPPVLRIIQKIDALIAIYDMPETMPNPLMRDRETSHRLQLETPLERLETPRFTRRGS